MDVLARGEVLFVHVSNMYPQQRMLQQLKRSFTQWLPWLRAATYAEVTIATAGPNSEFKVVARWKDGEHEKVYDIALMSRQGRVGCTKDYARAFVKEVLERRGAL